MTDDHVPAAMSCYGNKILHTPNLDRLAERRRPLQQLLRHQLAVRAGPRHCAHRMPLEHHHIYGNSEGRDAIEKMTPGIPTYPKLLQTGRLSHRHGRQVAPQRRPDGLRLLVRAARTGRLLRSGSDRATASARNSPATARDVTTDLALNFLKSAGTEKPWLLVYQHKAPHRPFKPAPRHAQTVRRYRAAPSARPSTTITPLAAWLKKPKTCASTSASRPTTRTICRKAFPPPDRKNWIYQRFVKDYYRAVYGVDENLASVLKYLDDTRQTEDTLILYSSDNGFFLGDHGWYDKRFMYEPSLRVPLLVRYPRLGAAGKVRGPHGAEHRLRPDDARLRRCCNSGDDAGP